MQINRQEASVLNSSLAPLGLTHQEWLPYLELLDIPVPNRYQHALAMQNIWLRDKKQVWLDEQKKFRDNSLGVKIVKVLIYLAIPILLLTALLNFPPASYITDFYQSLFNMQEYYPILNAALLYIPLVFILLYFDKK